MNPQTITGNSDQSTTNETTQVDFKSIAEQLTQIKEKGNMQFKKKSYKEAIKHFSEAVKLYEENNQPKQF